MNQFLDRLAKELAQDGLEMNYTSTGSARADEAITIVRRQMAEMKQSWLELDEELRAKETELESQVSELEAAKHANKAWEDYSQSLTAQTGELQERLTVCQEELVKHEAQASELQGQLTMALGVGRATSQDGLQQGVENAGLQQAKAMLEAQVKQLKEDLHGFEQRSGVQLAEKKRLETELATSQSKLTQESEMWALERNAFEGQLTALQKVEATSLGSQEELAKLQAELDLTLSSYAGLQAELQVSQATQGTKAELEAQVAEP
jgi:DNA repair exonuclease SbcCD ATPase subunit